MEKDFRNRNNLKTNVRLFTPIFFFMALLVLSSPKVFAKVDTVYVPSDNPPGEGNLNKAVNDILEVGTLSKTIFMLELNGYYVLTDSIHIPAGEHLTIIAPEPGKTQETAPPQIRCTTGITEYTAPFKTMFTCLGNITLKNIWLFFANTNGWQIGANVHIAYSPEVTEQQVGTFENVVFDYSYVAWDYSGAVGVATKNFKGVFKNCYWKNCTDQHFRYYGRAVSFPYGSSGWHIDSLTFENCTFANIGYVFLQEKNNSGIEGGNYSNFVKFNHCTFLNVVMYPLQSGYWNKLSVTNSMFVNCHMIGDFPIQHSGEIPYGGTIIIDSLSRAGFDLPFSEKDRRILFSHCSYNVENWLRDFMWNNPGSLDRRKHNMLSYIPYPQLMMNKKTIDFFESDDFPYMNKSALYDSINQNFHNPPIDTLAIKEFLMCKWWSGGCDWPWAWKPENSINRKWPLEENLAYTNDTLFYAGMNGFPLGDLYRWFPEKYELWKTQKETENERISYWLNYGKDSIFSSVKNDIINLLPKEYALYQNYPNPFNPETTISYQLPVAGNVSLKVYDVLGREVAVLVNDYISAGSHKKVFNGYSTVNKRQLASGVYFYQLKAGNFTDTKKFILLK